MALIGLVSFFSSATELQLREHLRIGDKGSHKKNGLFTVRLTVRGGGHPEPNSISKEQVFQGPHRTILGHPKHVSPNAIAKAFNVM